MIKPASLLFVLASIILFSSCNQKKESNSKVLPKNVVLLIGDGTGLSQISSAFYYKKSAVNYARFPHIGLIKTSSSRQDITDSAASGTAFACGEKTYNGAIGVGDDKTDMINITELAAQSDVKIGLVATSSITHATPASFYAHAAHRDMEEEIASQMAHSNVDFFAGGGLEFFRDRQDGVNLIDDLFRENFAIDTLSLRPFDDIKKNTKQGYILANDGMPKVLESRGDFLSQATLQGMQFLHQNDAPFFLMSEGSQIDWAGHDNDVEYLITELIDFDDTIGKVLDFAERDGETLVIVTADHETGGFTLAGENYINDEGKVYSSYSKLEPKFSTGGHSATLIPVFAYGPGAEVFGGVYENTEIFHKIIALTGWGSK